MPASRHASRPWVFVIVASVLAVYANSCDGPFIADDIPGITKNPDIQSLGTSLRALTDDRQSPLSGRPLVSLTFAMNYAAGELGEWGYHAVNVAIHLLNALLVFAMARSVLANPRWREAYGNVAVHLAGATALVWAMHPLHTETVNYVVQRTELLVAFFYLAAFTCAAIGCDGKRSHAWSMLVVPCAILGVFCKEVIVSLPLVILLYDAFFGAGGVMAALRKRPMMYVGLFGSWIALGAIIAGGPRSASVGLSHAITPWEYLLTQSRVLIEYLLLSFWPASLTISYADWSIARTVGEVVGSGFVIVLLLALSLFGLVRRSSAGLLGLSCFLILAPTSSFVPIVTEVAAERRMYLPLVAITLLFLIVLHHLYRKVSGTNFVSARNGLIATALTLALMLASRTFARNEKYQEALSIWSTAAAVRPSNHVAHCGVGHTLLELKRPQEALSSLQRSVELKADYIDGLFHRGRAFHQLKQYADEVTSFRRVLELDPQHYDAMYNLGLALQLDNRHGEAVTVYSNLLKEKRNNARASLNMGVALSSLGRNKEAAQALRSALVVDPSLANARYNLAWTLSKLGRLDDAIREFTIFLQKYPHDVQARLELASVFERSGNLAAAVNEYRKVIASEPSNAIAHSAMQRLTP